MFHNYFIRMQTNVTLVTPSRTRNGKAAHTGRSSSALERQIHRVSEPPADLIYFQVVHCEPLICTAIVDIRSDVLACPPNDGGADTQVSEHDLKATSTPGTDSRSPAPHQSQLSARPRCLFLGQSLPLPEQSSYLFEALPHEPEDESKPRLSRGDTKVGPSNVFARGMVAPKTG